MTYFYHSVVDSPLLPRDLRHDSAQNATITILGELWPWDAFTPVPSGAIVDVLSRIGISETATRAALSRLRRREILDSNKNGRNTTYTLSREVAESIPASKKLTVTFGAAPRPWDGRWTVVIYSMPETQRDKRHSLREWLRWLGFGPLRDGVWISPHADVELTYQTLDGVLPVGGLVMQANQLVGDIDAESVWPLGETRAMYDAFIAEFRPYIYSLRAGDIAPADALKLWIAVLGQWRSFPAADPDLPTAALPADWPRGEARRIFEAVHDGCLPMVEMLVRPIVAAHSPAAAATMRALTVSEIVDGLADSADTSLRSTEDAPVR